MELLEKTIGFYQMTRKRMAEELGSVDRFLQPHFRARWNLDRDLYAESIERQIAYLRKILADHRSDYEQHLRRGGLMDKLKKLRHS